MYKKQNFRPGEVLSAAQMDHIEDGLVEIEKNVIETLEDVKKSVSDRNTKIATAITEKGVATEPTDSADVMAENIRKIPTGTSNSQILSTTMISGVVQCRVTHEIDNTLD